MKAVASMIDSFYGGNLSQDRIAYYVYHDYLRYPSPQDDLGDGSGIMAGINIINILDWELNGSFLISRFMDGSPGFSEIEYWIDNNIPIIVDAGGTDHLLTIIDGYDTNGQMVEVLNPLTGNETMVPYDSVSIFVVWIVTGNNITARSDEPSIWTDSGGDGVCDFDVINRFHTDNKTLIELTYYPNFPTANFTCSPETPIVDEQITFDASQSSENITSYEWEFGDNNATTTTAPTINHAYDQPGTYNVTLTVDDINGRSNTTTSLVTVAPSETQGANSTDIVSETDFYRQSLDRTGYAPTEGPETPDLLWTTYLNDSVTTSPVVADGKVFIGTSGGTLYALDATSGDIIWTFYAGSPVSTSPAFQNGVVFFGTENPGNVYALDAGTGLPIWQYQVGATAALSSSPGVIDNMVVVGSSDGELLCLNESEGQLLWTTYIGGGPLSSPAIQNGTIYITSTIGVDAVDLQTGASIWDFATTWPVTSTPAVADGMVFVGTENNDRVYALNQSNGNPVWDYFTSGWLTPPAVDSSAQLVIVGSKDYKLYAFDEQTGVVEWKYFNGENYLTASTISANGLVYVGTFDGNLHCLNETTGEEIWNYSVTAPIISSPTIIDEHVLVGAQDGSIYCFGPPFTINKIVVSNLTESSFQVGQGYGLTVNVTAENQGDSAETFNMTIYANGTTIETNQITMMNGTSTTINFVWNTAGFAYGNYTISAFAWPVTGENNTANSNITGGVVTVTIPGDINGDGTVDIYDAIILAAAFNSKPGSPNWNANADINGDGIVDIYDAIILAAHFGQSMTYPSA